MKSLVRRVGALIVSTVTRVNARRAGVAHVTTTVNGRDVHAFESKSKGNPPVLFVHGLADDKTSFLESARQLSEQFDLYLVDLAGHGDNDRDASTDYSIAGQVRFLDEYASAKGLDAFALVGNSMGGHVAAAYAIRHPERVRSLVLLNAAGLDIDDHVVYTGFGPEIATKAELEEVLSRIFHEVPKLPAPVVEHMISTVNSSRELVNDSIIPAILGGEDSDLLDRIASITAPTLVLWGTHDEVVLPNVADAYVAGIGGAEYQALDNASHSPQLEIAEEVGTRLATFISAST